MNSAVKHTFTARATCR